MAYGAYSRVAAKRTPDRSSLPLPARAFPVREKPVDGRDPAERLEAAERFGHRLENFRVRPGEGKTERGEPLPGIVRAEAASGPVLQFARGKNQRRRKAYSTRARKRKEELLFGADPNRLLVLKGPRHRKGVARYGVGEGNAYGRGAYATSTGVPTRDVARRFTPVVRQQIARLGTSSGCHTCGTKTGPFVPDHQPPLSIHRLQHGTLANYRGHLMPHCRACSSKQGGALAKKIKKGP